MTEIVLAVSDSHGDVAALTAVLEWLGSTGITCSAAAFLGDGCDDLSLASSRARFSVPWYAVRGNGDYSSSGVPGSRLMEVSRRKLFLSHGNRYDVKESGLSLCAIARNAGAEAFLFGHTHVPYCDLVDGVFLLNPGSISRPRSDAGRTFALLECPDSGPLCARFFTLANRLGKNVVKQLHN